MTAERVTPLPVTDAEVSAYVDGQLPGARASEVEQAMAQDPALASRIAVLRNQNAALREVFDPWVAEPIPQALLAAAAPPAAERRWRRAVPWLGAAATLLLGVGVGWYARDAMLLREGTPTTFARQAALAHVLYASDANRPVEIAAAEEQRLVRWLSRRLGVPVRAPDLNSFGYALVGGRLVAGNEKPTALFMYENADKQRLTLQVRRQPPGTQDTAFRHAVEDGVGVYYWIDEFHAYALSGQIDRAQMLAIGRLVYGQLAAESAAPPPKQ